MHDLAASSRVKTPFHELRASSVQTLRSIPSCTHNCTVIGADSGNATARQTHIHWLLVFTPDFLRTWSEYASVTERIHHRRPDCCG
jgi:hypothetical protein